MRRKKISSPWRRFWFQGRQNLTLHFMIRNGLGCICSFILPFFWLSVIYIPYLRFIFYFFIFFYFRYWAASSPPSLQRYLARLGYVIGQNQNIRLHSTTSHHFVPWFAAFGNSLRITSISIATIKHLIISLWFKWNLCEMMKSFGIVQINILW